MLSATFTPKPSFLVQALHASAASKPQQLFTVRSLPSVDFMAVCVRAGTVSVWLNLCVVRCLQKASSQPARYQKQPWGTPPHREALYHMWGA